MALDAESLREGFVIAFHCVGRDIQESHQFLKGSGVDVRLTRQPTQTEPDGTRWRVHETANPGIFTFECDDAGGFLDGRTLECSVGLAPNSHPPFIGTAWKVTDLPNPDIGGFSHVTLQCQGNLGRIDQGQCPFGFLDGRTAATDGSVGLATKTEEPFSGTHWELIFWEAVVSQGVGGPSTGGDKPH